MKVPFILLLLAATAPADTCRALVDGAGCRTRQLAIQKIWEGLPEVDEVEILRREEAPEDNQRYFLLRCRGDSPSREQLVVALGRRAKHYHVLRVEPVEE